VLVVTLRRSISVCKIETLQRRTTMCRCVRLTSIRYQKWGEGEIGVIVAGNLMLKYVSVATNSWLLE